MLRASILISIIIFRLSPNGAFAQRFLVSNEAQNILYAGIQSPLAVVVDGVDCNSLVVKTNNGTIEQNSPSNTSCRYTITPDIIGAAKIFIYAKKGNKLKKVGEMVFSVKIFPPPEPAIGVPGKSVYSKKMLLAMGGVRAEISSRYGCGGMQVRQYKAIIIRNNEIVGVVDNVGAIYNPQLLQYLNEMQPDDQLFIYDIVVTSIGNKPLALPKYLRYTIVESDVDE